MKRSIILDKKNISRLLVFIFWMIVWEIVYLIINREIYLPSPFHVLMKLSEMIRLKSFWLSVMLSMKRVVIGFVLSIIIGTITGIASSFNRYIYQILYPLISTIKSTPVMSFIIIALIWFSSDNVPIFICFLMCIPIIWTNIVTGIRNVDDKLLEMAHVYDVKKSTILRKIYIPAIIPYFSAACVTALGLGWKSMVAAEVLSNPKYSIGSNLYNAKVYLESSELFAWTFVVVILSMIFEYFFGYAIRNITARKKVVKW